MSFFSKIPVQEPTLDVEREVQSLAIYGGEIYAGVWPWGEVWRYDVETQKWILAFRPFSTLLTHEQTPFKKITDQRRKDGAPYTASDNWGQRITALIPLGSKLYIATSNKMGSLANGKPSFDFITPEIEAQYGRVWSYDKKNQVTCSVKLYNKSYFDFQISDGQIVIYQNGEKLCSAKIDKKIEEKLVERLKNGRLIIGNGIYGKFQGDFIQQIWRTYR